MTIDEEITTLIKGMDHDKKRLANIVFTYTEKRGEEVNTHELNERKEVSSLIQEACAFFQRDINE